MTAAEKKKQFNQILFRSYKVHYRPMAWRNTHDPYRILVSEIMLQQTQVERVRTKYAAFLNKFPNTHALAHASLGDVLRVWSGLGYNRRAKFLHECAKKVITHHAGKFPDDMDELRALPGVGISTAAALSAFAFGHDEPMIDTNIRRIICRVFFKKNIPSDKELYAFAKALVPKGKGRMWNYAMLDLGATLCTARNHSDKCPMQKLHGKVSDFVYKKPQKKFAHSNRLYRGRVLAVLVAGSVSKSMLQRELGLPTSRFDVILGGLTREKLIVQKGKMLLLP